MTTLITGANGFVGAAVIRKLLARGHATRALVRSGSDRRNLTGLEADIVTGDLTDPASLKQAVAGCDCLFHVAADYRLWAPDPERMYRTNVDGARDLLRLAAAAGVEKMVYTSSVATLGINPDQSPADETTPVALEDMVGHYKRSKFLAEQAVRELFETENVPVVIVNPAAPVGPRDIKPTPTGRIILDTMQKKMPAYVNTGLNIVHVDDVAQGHLLALERGAPGERYILGGDNLSLQKILHTLCELADLKPPRLRLAHDLVLPLAWLAERWARLSGKRPFATVDGINMARKFMYYSSAKAEQQLGYTHRPARQALRDALCWFRENGY